MLTLPHRILLLIISGALVSTIIILGLAMYAQVTYQQHNAYFFDPVYYQYYNAVLYERLQDESRVSVAVDELLNNDRHPLRTIPLVLLAPQLLANPYGHLVSIGIALVLMLSLVGYLVYVRKQSLVYAVVTQFCFTALPILYNITNGIGNYWLEWGASVWLGCALCFILLAEHFPKQSRWLVGFAISAAAAMLSRYIAGVFVAVVCIVPFSIYLWRRWQLQRRWREVLISLGITIGLIGGLAGYFLVTHLVSNVSFYTDYGYAINQTLSSSWQFIWTSSIAQWQLQGPWHNALLYVGVVVVAINLIISLRRQTVLYWGMSLWVSVAVPLTLLALGTVGAFHPLLYGLFPVALACLIPAPMQIKQRWQKFSQIGLVGIVVCATLLSINQQRWKINQLMYQTLSPEKSMNQQIASGLAQVSDDTLIWQTFFDEYGTIPTMELFYATRKLALPAGQPFFNRNVTAWQADYPGLTKEQVAERVYAATSQWVDVAVVFAEPEKGVLSGWINNEYSTYITDYMARTIQTDPNWEKIFVIQSGYSADLWGYRNLRAEQSDDVFRGHLNGSQVLRP